MNENANALNWFEISVSDIDRATKFYETVFAVKLEQREMLGAKMAMFPSAAMSGKVGGTLVQGPHNKPAMDGAKIYLNANPDVAGPLSRVEAAGGKILMPKTNIGEDIGYIAFIIDTEGNAVGMQSKD